MPSKKWKNVAARNDSDISDDPAGARRIELAAQSTARKAAEAADRRRKNAALKLRLAGIKASTDNQLDTEAAATRRSEMEAEGNARRAAEQVARWRHARAMESKIKSTGSRTDNLMDTEVAAIARAEVAASSKARKAAEEAERTRQNTEMEQRIKKTPSKTDNLMDTEAAAIARAEMAAASRARKKQEAADLVKFNAEMKRKIARARDPDFIQDPVKNQLLELINEPSYRKPSDVSTPKFIAYTQWADKMAMGDATRREQKQHEEMVRQQQQNTLEQVQQRVAAAKAENEASKERLAAFEERLKEQGRLARIEAEKNEAHKRRAARRYAAKIKARVTERRNLASKLGASEEATDAQERHEASQMRLQLLDTIHTTRTEEDQRRRDMAQSARGERRQFKADKEQRMRTERAQYEQDKRDELAFLRSLKDESEQEYMDTARRHREEALAGRENARATAERIRRERHEATRQYKQYLGDQSQPWSLETVTANVFGRKERVSRAYGSKWVSAEQAEQFISSPLHKLHEAVKTAMETSAKAIRGGKSPFHASSPEPSVVKI